MFSLNDMRTVTNLYSRQKDVLSFNQRLATMALLISFAACEGLGRHARSKHVACLCAHDGEAGYATGMMNLHDQKDLFEWLTEKQYSWIPRGFSTPKLATQHGLGHSLGLRPSSTSPIHSQETLCQAHRDYRSGWRQYPKRRLRPTTLYSVLQNQSSHDAANPWRFNQNNNSSSSVPPQRKGYRYT